MKLKDCIADYIPVEFLDMSRLRELRVRNGCPVKINLSGKWYYINKNTVVSSSVGAFKVGDVCDEIVKKACNNSVYVYENTLADGFFTLEDGVRVGVCGRISGAQRNVFQKYTSLCFRVPHQVNCISDECLERCKNGNTIVIGAPSSGKTTFLRDLAIKLSKQFNVLVVDERGELFYGENESMCDVLKWGGKTYAFEIGLRAMSPDFVVCDELTESDVKFVKACAYSGVKIACSAHGNSVFDVERRLAITDYFDNRIVLKSNFEQFFEHIPSKYVVS